MDIKEPQEDRRKEPIPGEYGFPIPKELFFRELGFGGFSMYHNYPRYNAGKKVVSQSLATKAVHTLCTKEQLTRRRFKLPNGARTTFHIAFSADGTKVASCHGDHNVYVCDVASGEVIQTLTGHPRTPWCVVFHPTQNDVLASGCLAGHVRVWDLRGGSELLITDSGTVIASLAFHPTVRLLAVATFNEIVFWDWSHPYPLARCSTENTKEKVRLVRFDRLGRSLITGITNFPSPPSREEVRRPVRGGSPFFRPNILSRNFSRRRPPPYVPWNSRNDGNSRNDDLESMDDVSMVNEGEVVEEVVVPDPEETEAEAFAVAAAAVAAEEDPLIVGETLNARQDRFQESYRQLVSHYEELVSNYQQFLRSRIPRILETSSSSPSQASLNMSVVEEPVLPQMNPEVVISQMEARFETDQNGHSPSENEPSDTEASSTTILESPASPVMDDEVPGPSRLLLEPNPEVMMEIPETIVLDPTPSSSTSSVESANTSTGTTTGVRSDTDLRSIEALAQNILEMQNLCSQVRMDAPLAVENQHIMELRVIRRHLELLQEQTRDLQSSIRATLNSLATGSLAALRSHVANAANNAANSQQQESRSDNISNPFLNLEQATPPTPIGPGPVMDFENTSPPLSPARNSSTNGENPAIVNAEIGRRARQHLPSSMARNSIPNPNPNASGPNTLYRIMIATPFTESSRLPNTPLFNRIRVPPMVAMQYELPEPFSRNQPPREEPVPGPSREANNTSSSGNGRGRPVETFSSAGPRRIVREFTLVSGRNNFVTEEHARHCPFSGRDPYHWRPPPRMRSLYDMGETPPLVMWPTMDTGMETSIRNYRGVTNPASHNRQVRAAISNITITVRNGSGGAAARNSDDGPAAGRIPHFMNFSQWMFTSGISIGNITSDVLVGIYLSIRQIYGTSYAVENGPGPQSEQWQQIFGNVVPGVALIPPALRQGQRLTSQTHRCQHRRRRTHWICYNHNSPAHASRPCSIPSTRNNELSSSSSNQDEYLEPNFPPGTFRTSPPSQSRRNNFLPDSSQSSGGRTLTEQSSGERGGNASSAAASNSKSGKPIPTQLERNFTRVFYIRATDEMIPVYSTVSNAESVIGTEVRESLQTSVYYLPIGLFLQGGPWEANTHTIGIHWPPFTREEEYAILDLRVSERPLRVYQSEIRESYRNNRRYPRIRIDYDESSLRVSLPTGFTLNFIQSGLTLLDCFCSTIDLPRPRPTSGTLWIDYLGPFLDALERMFGLRNSRRGLTSVPTGHRIGAFLGRSPPWPPTGNATATGSTNASARPSVFPANIQPSNPLMEVQRANSSNGGITRAVPIDFSNPNPTNNAASTSINRERPATGSSRRTDVGERLRTMTRRIITLAPDAENSNRRRFYEDNPMILSHGYMYDNNGGGPSTSSGSGVHRNFLDRNSDRRFYFRHRHRHDHGFSSPYQNGEVPRDMPSSDGSRFIRLAVDTAASEVLRRNRIEGAPESLNNGLPVVEAGNAGGFSTIGRPVESRIERVLNERGNRGAHSPSPHGFLDEPSRNRMRLEEIQMRISMLSQWSRARAMATSGTQTPPSFIRPSWTGTERPTHSANSQEHRDRLLRGTHSSGSNTSGTGDNGVGTGSGSDRDPRVSRRRPYSRIARLVRNEGEENSEEDEILVSLPPRIPRLNDQNPPPPEYERPRADRPDSAEANIETTRNTTRQQAIDHWILRSLTPNSQQRFRSAAAAELSGSARTRAPPQNRFPTENADRTSSSDNNNEAEGPRSRIHRAGRAPTYSASAANASNDGNNNNLGNGNDEGYQDPGARFYPGYIPEILITPRTRPPTYYTMDAATTAFLSSRIQKWDFSEFLIPDITKRDESVVVRECSLHSDACLDVSNDSEFLAVLQPSDGGSYSSVGIYSLREDSLGEILSVYHFDQNTVSVSISPSCDYLVVGYAGRGPLYRFVHPSRGIGKILSLTRDEECFKLVNVKDLFADGQVAFMSINCMHWVPVAGYGIVYGTNTGDLVLLS